MWLVRFALHIPSFCRHKVMERVQEHPPMIECICVSDFLVLVTVNLILRLIG